MKINIRNKANKENWGPLMRDVNISSQEAFDALRFGSTYLPWGALDSAPLEVEREIRITTQAEWDALPKKLDPYTIVYIDSKPKEIITIKGNKGKLVSIRVCGHSWVRVENAQVSVYDNAFIKAYKKSVVLGYDDSFTYLWANSKGYGCQKARFVKRNNKAWISQGFLKDMAAFGVSF